MTLRSILTGLGSHPRVRGRARRDPICVFKTALRMWRSEWNWRWRATRVQRGVCDLAQVTR